MTNFVFTAFWSTIVAVLMINSVATNVHYITTNNTDDSNSNTLKHYLDNPKKYFTSYSQLIFFPGEYQLDVDLVFENIKIFTMTAIESCKIYCSSNVSFLVINVTKFEVQNISLINCGKNHTSFLDFKEGNDTNSMISNKTSFNYNSSIFLYHCALVRIINVNISVRAHFGGILAMNVKERFVLDSVKVQLECLDNKFNHSVYGILFRYNNRRGNKSNDDDANVALYNFNYEVNGSCIHFSRYALMVLLVQYNYSVNITVKDTKFQNLNCSGALYYYMLSCKKN